MVANRAIKQKAREYAEDFGVDYPRALAEVTAPGLAVPLHSMINRERFGFDPRTDRHLILTGTFEMRGAVLERVFERLYFRPGVERFIIDITGDLAPSFEHLAEDGSEGAALNTDAAARVLRSLIHNATTVDSLASGPEAWTNILAVNGLPELLNASPECAGLLSRLITITRPAQSLILAGDWIGGNSVPDGPQLKLASRLHFGPLPELAGLPRPWVELDPKEGEGLYHRRGYAAEKIKFEMAAPTS